MDTKHLDTKHQHFPGWLRSLLILLIAVGVVFRFVNLNHKVYWHDEVYTTLRASGYFIGDINRDLFQNRMIRIGDLQTFQQIKPGSGVVDTIQSLMKEDPQHPPLYFLAARWWMQLLGDPLTAMFGSSLTVSRSLPALLSLLALPFMYGLAWELFFSQITALLATTLVALSPFEVLFAQTARQYSLLTVMVIASSYLLLRALRLPTWKHWAWFGLSVAIGLYTHPFFGLTTAGHVVYVAWRSLSTRQSDRPSGKALLGFVTALALAGLLFAPWMAVMVTNRERVLSTTNWAQGPTELIYLIRLWILSFTAIFVDPPELGFNNPVTYLIRLPFVVLILTAFYVLLRRTSRSTWLFVLTSFLIPFLLLVLPDFLMGGKRSAVSRYLISCYPAIYLAVAFLLSSWLAPVTEDGEPTSAMQKTLQRGVFAMLCAASLFSLTASAMVDEWWSKDLSYFNGKVADRLQAIPNAMLVSDYGNDFTNTGDLISLSYRFKNQPDFPVLLLKQYTSAADLQVLEPELAGKAAIAFRASKHLENALEQTYRLRPIYREGRLWQICPRTKPDCQKFPS